MLSKFKSSGRSTSHQGPKVYVPKPSKRRGASGPSAEDAFSCARPEEERAPEASAMTLLSIGARANSVQATATDVQEPPSEIENTPVQWFEGRLAGATNTARHAREQPPEGSSCAPRR